MGVIARRGLDSVLLVLIGTMLGIGVDRALLRPGSLCGPGTTEPSAGSRETSNGVRAAVTDALKDPAESLSRPAPAASISSREVELVLREALGRRPSPERLRAMEEACRLLAPSELPRALRMVDRLLRREPEWDAVLTSMGARWVESDPESAISCVKSSLVSVPERALFGILRELGRKDPEAARELLLAIPPERGPSSLRDGLTRTFAEAWAGHDLASAVSWLQELPEGGMQTCAIQGILETWSLSDPRVAAAYFESFPGHQRQYLPHVAGIWARRNPSEASSWATGLPPGLIRSQVLGTIISVWALDDAVAASSFASSVTSSLLPEDREEAFGAIVRALAEVDIESASSWLRELSPEEVSMDAVEAIWTRLAEKSPESASTFLASLPPGPARSIALDRLATLWAHRDVAKALSWLDRLEGEDRSSAFMSVFLTWAESDPDAVSAYARKLPFGNTRDDALGACIRKLAYVDPEKATTLLEGMSAGDSRDGAALELVFSWSGVNPSRAASWAETFPEGKLRKSAMESVASTWATYDSAGAERWLSKLPRGESRDASIGGFIDTTVSQDPVAASVWASRIDDPSQRTVKLELVGRNWLETDPDAARQWILNSSLPDDMKTQLLDPAK